MESVMSVSDLDAPSVMSGSQDAKPSVMSGGSRDKPPAAATSAGKPKEFLNSRSMTECAKLSEGGWA